MKFKIICGLSLFAALVANATAIRAATGTDSPALKPAEMLAALKIPADLQIEQVLTEPAIGQPIFCRFDERGRLWVVQYLQYPFPAGLKILSEDKYLRATYDKVPPPPPHHFRGKDKITIHEDTDGDGGFDKHKTFVDGLNIATFVCPGRGGVWVLNPPYLLFYPDRDNDDVPDGDPEVHLQGFGMEDTHSVVNNSDLGAGRLAVAAQGSTVTGDMLRPGLDKTSRSTRWGSSSGVTIRRLAATRSSPKGAATRSASRSTPKGRVFSGHNGGDTRGFHYVQGGYSQRASASTARFRTRTPSATSRP